MSLSDVSEIEIRITFERGIGDPTRIFRTMTGLIESAQSLDSHLAQCIGSNVRTSLVLQDVETSSLKAKLRTVIETLPDEALKAGEIKKVIGHFIVVAKHKILDWCSERDEITDINEVKKLQSDVQKLAESADVKLLPAYAPIELPILLADISAIHQALMSLSPNDAATLTSGESTSAFNPTLEVSQAIIRELVTREKISTRGERIIKVKKPDYLGSSQWEFKYAGKSIEAKILDKPWLNRFQSNQVQLNPGDSLRVVLNEVVSYGYDSEIVEMDYEVVEVKDVLPGLKAIQGLLT